MAKSSKKAAPVKKQPAQTKQTQSPKTAAARPPQGLKSCEDPSLEAYLLEIAGQKFNQLEHCDEGHEADCPCGSTGGGSSRPQKVDLMILIDTSGSMGPKAQAINDAATAAMDQAKKQCNVDLQATWLGIEGTYGGTQFNQTCRNFLNANGCTAQTADPGHNEEGADSIADLSNCPNIWREGACRAIFYISDEPLNRGAGQGPDDDAATVAAIAAAQANNVRVFAHLAPGTGFDSNPGTIQNFTDLCVQTGGQAFIGNPATVAEYEQILVIAICQACSGCTTLELPEASPCFSVSWGDSDCDCLETNDFELLLIKVCNCYSNVSFQNLSIGRLILTDSAGNPVSNLPDGTPSVEVLPSGPICFGDLGPCVNNTPTCKAREIVIRTRGALPGTYQLKFVNICFDVVNHFATEECFLFNLCRD